MWSSTRRVVRTTRRELPRDVKCHEMTGSSTRHIMYTATGPDCADGYAQTSPRLLHIMTRINNKLYAKHIPSMNPATAGLLLSVPHSSVRVATCHFLSVRLVHVRQTIKLFNVRYTMH